MDFDRMADAPSVPVSRQAGFDDSSVPWCQRKERPVRCWPFMKLVRFSEHSSASTFENQHEIFNPLSFSPHSDRGLTSDYEKDLCRPIHNAKFQHTPL